MYFGKCLKCAVNLRDIHPYILDGCPLIKNMLSEATFGFPMDCAMMCLQDPFCAGYNFKLKQRKSNCQLTHTLDHKFHDCKADDKGWIFYHPVGPRKVQNFMHCYAMDSCLYSL